MRTRLAVDVLERAVADVPDPEVPVVTIEDLGILRAVEADEATGRVRVTITPTYSGCPAMAVIERGIVHAAGECGWAAEVVTVLSPPWTTDWVSERGREAMRRFGIAPPGAAEPRVLAGAPSATPGPVMVAIGRREVACPLCGSTDTEELSRFGSTSCKALRRCLSCAEPFEEFKAI